MTTSSQDRRFLDEVIGTALLDTVIDWIKDNLEPGDVFDKEKLDDWATDNDYVIPEDTEE